MADREAPNIGPVRMAYVECMKCRSARSRLVRVEVPRHEVPPSVEAFVECLECRHQCLITITEESGKTHVGRIPLPCPDWCPQKATGHLVQDPTH
jgi:hypothetical protein